MEIPRPALVSQLRLVLSCEGRGFGYLLADRANGKILRLPRQAALAYSRFAAAVAGHDTGRTPSDEEARTGLAALQMIRQMRDAERFKPGRINPVMISFPLLDLAPWQPHVTRLADLAFGAAGALLLVGLAFVAVILGIRNDGAILTEFDTVFSLSALLTFALISPVLKLIHEFGHMLAATRYRVRLRKGGINLIALYPVPFVDCTEADLTASRGQRMMISGAGILTDLVIGLMLFIGWHLVESGLWQLVLGQAFVFNTVNSLLFNANPLMRMDGYFILCDLLGRRNLGTDAGMALRQLRRGLLGQGPVPALTSSLVALVTYALASTAYRIAILVTLLWAILPQYLGLGMVLGLWAGLAMIQPLLANQAKTATPAEPFATRFGPGLRLALLGLALVGFLFVPVAPVALVDLTLDVTGAHAVTTTRAGFVVIPPPLDARMTAGQVIATLQSQAGEDALAMAQLGLAEAQILAQVGRGAGAAGDQMGEGRLKSATARLALAEETIDLLTLRAPGPGHLTLTAPLRSGQYLPAGATIGQFLPQDGALELTGIFPEARVTAFDRGLTQATLWDGTTYLPLDPADVQLVEQVLMDQNSLQRGFALKVRALFALQTHAAPQIRLQFQPIPIWRHLADWMRGVIARFRDAEIAERQNRIETP